MAPNEVTCELCGGTNFYIQEGNHYCTQCQQSSQDIREQIFDIPEATTATGSTSTKRIRKEKKQDQLTSWECYNYILLGLVNELIELGANSNLKRTIHILWFKYLKKLEVISDKPNTLPRLCAVNNQKDAEILFGRAKRKRLSSRTLSPSSVSGTLTTDTSILRRKQKPKQRRSMVLAEYDQLNNTMQSEDTPLHNQSLTNSKSSLDSLKTREDRYLRYNSGSKKQLLSIMSKTHLLDHCKNTDSLLDCRRKIPHRLLPHKFIRSYEVLSRNKIYALIYLGLLINKDKIQLGDMLRFIREGHLSFSKVDHFFPEEFDKSLLNIKYWNYSKKIFCHFRLREMAANIAKNLKITKYIPQQNLVQLCQRYCTELNLPGEYLLKSWKYSQVPKQKKVRSCSS